MAIEQHDRLHGADVPHPGRTIPPGRDQQLAVGVPGQGRNAVGVARQLAEQFALRQVPQGDDAIFMGRGQLFAVAAEGQGADRCRRARQLMQQLMARGVPEANGAVIMSGGDVGRIGMARQGGHPRRLRQGREHLARGSVPERQIIAGGDQEASIVAETPECFQIAQGMPLELLAGLGVPVPQHAGILDGPEGAVRGESQGQKFSIGMQLRLAEHPGAGHLGRRHGGNGHGMPRLNLSTYPSPWGRADGMRGSLLVADSGLQTTGCSASPNRHSARAS